jgi:hypothetical protein
MVRRICKLTETGLSGKDLTLSWFTKRIQPLQFRDRLMYEYSGRDDTMRATKDNLSCDALDKRLRVLIKVSPDVHTHVCHSTFTRMVLGQWYAFSDLITNSPFSPTNFFKDFILYSQFDSLEEKDLGTLTRIPHAGTSNPEAASDAEIPEGHHPAKRKRGAASGSAPIRAREAPSAAATKKIDREKQRLKEIDIGKGSQGSIERFFSKPG